MIQPEAALFGEVTRRGGRAWGWTDRCENPHLPMAGGDKLSMAWDRWLFWNCKIKQGVLQKSKHHNFDGKDESFSQRSLAIEDMGTGRSFLISVSQVQCTSWSRQCLLWRLQEQERLVVDGQQRALLLRKCALISHRLATASVVFFPIA